MWLEGRHPRDDSQVCKRDHRTIIVVFMFDARPTVDALCADFETWPASVSVQPNFRLNRCVS